MSINIGINGFGRIGRTFLRASRKYPEIKVVQINDPAPAATLCHLLKYDSIHRKFPEEIVQTEEGFIIGKDEIKFSHERQPSQIAGKMLILSLKVPVFFWIEIRWKVTLILL